ncbi:MAG: AmmeMemoRadiSam system protein B [Acidobacteria bacterium]|nr:MAG: AmmeMemoRadiSam system protein B [Acidobacteriota bacterium]
MRGARPPAVAGTFYPDDAWTLRRMVDDYLAAGRDEVEPRGTLKAVIAPHAGYLYSGPVAGSAFAAFGDPQRIARVVVIGPSHHVAFRGLALPPADRFTTPFGSVPIDLEAAGELRQLPQVTVDALPHAREHALEVELPFLQRLIGDFELVPLVVGRASPAEVAQVLDRLWGGDETRFVISSDLSHFLDYDTARRVDAATARTIRNLGGPLDPSQACGAAAINGFTPLARQRGLEVSALDLRNSGDTAGGRDRVVGYGAFSFNPADGG